MTAESSVCGACFAPIPAKSPSDDYCSEACQRTWLSAQTVPLDDDRSPKMPVPDVLWGRITRRPAWAPPRRIQRKRSAGWKAPEGAVYVGRPSRWGNPYPAVTSVPSSRAVAVELYEGWLRARPEFADTIRRELAGRDLMCWCPADAPCHATVLLRVAQGGQP